MIKFTSNDFIKIIIEDIPLIDVRAPIEYEKGAFLNSVNLPIMNDEERHLVGICYKEKGNEEAVKLGHKLVSGEVKQIRIDAWVSQLEKYPESMIYCFRGGQRSQITQEWIFEATGKSVARLDGGYKAFRNYLINALEPSEQTSMPILLGGLTGAGKSKLLEKLDNSIDLEGIANHRGSSFGRFITPQPTQINFENNLAFALIKHKNKDHKYMILEDEGQHVGKCFIYKPLFEYFTSGKLVVLERPFEERLNATMNEYVIESQADYIKAFGQEQGLLEWSEYIKTSIDRIKSRLGGDWHKKVLEAFGDAFTRQSESGKSDLHKNWVGILLNEYYDPMYEHQLKKRDIDIVFRGNEKDTFEYLKYHCEINPRA